MDPGDRYRPVNKLVVTADSAVQVPTAKDARQRIGRAEVDEAELRLVAACVEGDRAAMEALYHRFKRRVFGLVAKMVGPHDAEEVAQEVFVRVFRGLAKFRGDSAIGTWIYRLSVNCALTHLERKKAPSEGEDVLSQVPAADVPLRDPHLAERLEAALMRLPAGYRAVMVLHDVEGLSHEEIGTILGCRIGTSKSQLFKARAKMRELLEGQG